MSAPRVVDLLAAAARCLRLAGIASPAQEAAALLALVLHQDKTFLYAHPEFRPASSLQKRFLKMVLQRQKRVPFAYVTGQSDFLDLTLKVRPGVLVPRPETEVLAEFFLRKIQAVHGRPKILDLGTGTGCLAIAVARMLGATVWAVDRSVIAVRLARANVRKLGLSRQVSVLHGDLYAPLSGRCQGTFDGIVSNPPYIRRKALRRLMPEVRHEPRLALDGGADGLDIVRRIISGAPLFLKAGGWLALEVGKGQSGKVVTIMRKAGFRSIESIPDLCGVQRVVVGRK